MSCTGSWANLHAHLALAFVIHTSSEGSECTLYPTNQCCYIEKREQLKTVSCTSARLTCDAIELRSFRQGVSHARARQASFVPLKVKQGRLKLPIICLQFVVRCMLEEFSRLYHGDVLSLSLFLSTFPSMALDFKLRSLILQHAISRCPARRKAVSLHRCDEEHRPAPSITTSPCTYSTEHALLFLFSLTSSLQLLQLLLELLHPRWGSVLKTIASMYSQLRVYGQVL